MALNFGPPILNFEPLGNLGKAYFDAQATAQDRGLKQQRQQLLANLGQGNPDYNKVGLGLLATGDVQSGVALLGLGQKDKERQAEQEWFRNATGGGATQQQAPASPQASAGSPNEIETRFLGTVQKAGLNNPYGLAAVAATGKRESGFSPNNVNRTWNDPSESGQPGTAGGIMSWRGPRLAALQQFASQKGEAQPSVETQAEFLAKEDPTLIPRLNAAKSAEEANQIMANAWRFAGYNRQGGELGQRLGLTQQYAQRFANGQPTQAAQRPGVQIAETEADVQRMEAQQARQPVQMAQNGQVASDAPSQGAQAAQGFSVPGATPEQAQSIARDPAVQKWATAAATAPTDRARD